MSQAKIYHCDVCGKRIFDKNLFIIDIASYKILSGGNLEFKNQSKAREFCAECALVMVEALEKQIEKKRKIDEH